MKARISKIMEMKGMNSTQFAATTGIKTATLSHIFSGRTYPSTEVITKILEKFPDISPDWLIFGKNEILRTGRTPSASDNQLRSIFENKTRDRDTVKKETEILKNPDKKEITYIEKPSKTIDKLVIFYTDNSFETFVKEK
ncbi:MAG: helix-turn-helix domain-containing protein [Prevotellaceae bacterium]|jgi:transcriptional regulator with XRE-family HTH domain|nr:helix-turn-helix domain-containing protein [Prevotellaceae bacterium]